MAKQFSFSTEARQKLAKGSETVRKAVAVTLGAKGRNVLIERAFVTPQVTKDGVTVAKSCSLSDPYEAMGAELVKEASIRTNDLAGDGTTTAVVLADAFYREGSKMVSAGAMPTEVKAEIDRDVAKVVENLKAMAKPIEGKEAIVNIAAVSANGDRKLAEMIAEASEKIGKDGILTVEDGNGAEMEMETVVGLQVKKGWVSPYFVTREDKMECELDNPYVLVTDAHITAIKDIAPVIEQAFKESRSLIVFCKKIDGEALQLLVLNKMQGKLRIAACELPSFGDEMQGVADDIATVTGANVIRVETGRLLSDAKIADCGGAKRVVLSKDTTLIVEGKGDKDSIDGVAKYLNERAEQSKHEMEKERLRERIARLKNGIGVIKVGGATDIERREAKDRVVDAVSAVKAALAEGVLVGGGKALLIASEGLANGIVKRVCSEPMRQIADNAGFNGELIVEKVRELPSTHGFNAVTGDLEDLEAKGIIDPLKVTRLALIHAASVAGLLLTTEAVIVEEKKETK